MTVMAMHQPNVFPWIGYFYKMARADVFVVLDSVQIPDGSSYSTRVKIEGGWLTIPVHRNRGDDYNTATVAEGRWTKKAIKRVRQVYGRTEYYQPWMERILFEMPGMSLGDANRMGIVWLMAELGIETRFVLQSEIGINPGREMLATELCQALDCDTYLSGAGARDYNNPVIYERAGIELRYMGYGEYGKLSAIHYLFNYGRDYTKELLCRD